MRPTSSLVAACTLACVATAVPTGHGSGHGSRPDTWDELRGKVKHVVYLMLENRSFDNIAGYWDFHPDIDGLKGRDFCNDYTNPNWTVWNEPLSICAEPNAEEVPVTDPDHSFSGTNYELYQKWNPTHQDNPTMGGFIERQSAAYNATPGKSAFVMKGFSEKKTQTLATLAKNFAFFDSYHAEHPGPTNPNRQYATAGSSCGWIDTTLQSAGFMVNSTGPNAIGTSFNCTKSIFQRLSEKGISWKNYYESDILDGWLYSWVQENSQDKLVHADQFYRDLEAGTLPTFSYINPAYFTSMHPTSNLAAGEQMIKHLYDSVRKSKYWDNVLIVINFDEHGGFADHVPPPVDIPAPEDGIKFSGKSNGVNVTYDFTRLGVRVPAFLISPWIPANTLIHDDGTMYAHNSAYTHTSFLHFLQELWGLEKFNNRVQWAKTFEHVFSDTMRQDTPAELPKPIWYGGSEETQPHPYYLLNQDYSYYAVADKNIF